MQKQSLRCRRRGQEPFPGTALRVLRRKGSCSLLLAVLAAVVLARSAAGYTPESPEVKRAVARAIRFLESDDANDGRIGARALVGLALLKNGAKPEHPKVIQSLEAIQGRLGDLDPEKVRFGEIYSPGLAAIFLVELDPGKYASEIQCLIDYLQLQQKPHGGWGYLDRQTGDTSMTQYGVLSSWEATQAGFRVPIESVEGVATWLLKTQDPSGAFGYQGTVSDTFALVQQSGVRHSMAAAGLGSVYICADLLGLVEKVDDREDGLPPALKEVKQEEPAGGAPKPKTRIDPRLLREAQARGNRWIRANYVIDPEGWTHYYMYALERYMSFRELAQKGSAGDSAKESNWYNDGVRYLIDTQADNGSWESRSEATADTSFGVLFLLRSTKKSIEKARNFGDGMLIGGRGLPKESDRVVVRKGKVVATPLLDRAQQLLAALDSPDDPEFAQAVEQLAELTSQQAEELIGEHANRLRRLAGERSPEARVTAVRTLAKTRNLENAPTLIYALTDPDPEIVREARDALRRISRRPSGFGLSDRPAAAELRTAIENWKAWYLAIRPDAEFEN